MKLEKYDEGVLFQILYSIDGNDIDTENLLEEVYKDDEYGNGSNYLVGT